MEDAQRPEPKPSRRNPDWKPDPENDRVLRFIDACETLAGISPAEMATWFSDKGEQRPGTRDRMLSNAHAASDVLNKFQENIKC